MKKLVGGIKIIVFIALTIVLFVSVTINSANETYDKRAANEEITTVDTYSMNNHCKDNAAAVMDALKNSNTDTLESIMLNSKGIDSVVDFADWSKADFDNAVSMGSGSLTKAPDKNGKQDVSERFFVKVGDTKYVFFIETVCSRLGRDNDGVSAIAVTSFSHFDAGDYAWNGEKDGSSALAGELFWNK